MISRLRAGKKISTPEVCNMKIIFMGTPDFAVSTLKALISGGHDVALAVTQPDRPRGRKGGLQYPPVKECAIENGIEVYQPEKVRSDESIKKIKETGADVIVVAAYGQILPKAILDIPKYGCINVHASLLPKYRGAAPIQWAIINGDKETGVTTMQMGPGLDDGDILEEERVPIGPEMTGGELFDLLADVGGRLCVKTLSDIEKGLVVPKPQDENEATHVGMLTKQMGNINWEKTGGELYNLIRGLNPWPSAYSYMNGKMIKIWKSDRELRPDGLSGIPDIPCGTVVSTDERAIYVKTGDSILALTTVQLEGKVRMSAGEFLRGHKILPGDVFSRTRTE